MYLELGVSDVGIYVSYPTAIIFKGAIKKIKLHKVAQKYKDNLATV